VRQTSILIIALLFVAACGSSGKELSEPEATVEQQVDAVYPPNTDAELAAIFDPLLEPYGVQFTRGSLNDTSDGYENSDTGNHLALYVEPVGEYSDEDYIDGLYTITAAATPFVFASVLSSSIGSRRRTIQP
jgi:hypothetical protein